jgi:KinB signaling pathway activation protein
VNARKLTYLMGTTFLWGGLAGLITGIILSFQDPKLSDWDFSDWMIGTIGWFGGGLIFSALSLLGFFAFLMINQLGLGLLKGPRLWGIFLIILMLVTFYDVVEIRYAQFAQEGESYYSYFILPLIILVWGILVAYRKMKETNKNAFIPALFFMFTITILELVPAMRQNNLKSILDMGIPLIVANSWQILTLHKLIGKKGSESNVAKGNN